MDFFAPKFRRNPNEKVQSLYYGVANGNQVATRIVKPSQDHTRMETTETTEPGIPRGQGGQIAVLIIGGMETTLDEIEYILEAKKAKDKEKPFVPKRSQGEIAEMCRLLMQRRWEQIKYYKKNPSEAPKAAPKKTVRLHLPVGFRYANTAEPGLNVLARI